MDPEAREALADLLLAWEDAFRAGHDVSAAELVGHQFNLIEPLERRIRVLKATYWIDHAQDPPEDEADQRPSGGRMLGGRYRLDERIAVGGFAEVWRAYDAELQRTVAIKIPKASRIAMKDAFLAEARRVARLRHPSITSVHDVGIDGEECFIVSEFMDGGSLADRLAHGPIDTSQAIRWIGQIADALDFAHREGVIHRDVKPANILLNHHGDAMLADFGIAQSATKTGMFAPSIGTLRYMAPEQLRGSSVGPAADIYSLGIVLHETITGATPHASDSLPAIRREVIEGEALPLAPTLPSSLATVCRRAINRDPARRQPSAAAFAAELRRSEDPKDTPRLSRRHAIALAALLIATAAVVQLASRRRTPSLSRVGAGMPTPVKPAAQTAPMLMTSADPPQAAITFLRIEDSLPYVIDCQGVGVFREWQEAPDTYIGPLHNDVVCFVTYRFDAATSIRQARLIAESRCWDFTREPGGMGRGCAAIDASRDGLLWISVHDAITDSQWAGVCTIDEHLPESVLGGRSLWIRARLLTNGSPNTAYSVAQFGRTRDDPSQPTFGIVADLDPIHDAAESTPR